jgi:hypothetical protein
MRLHCGAGPSGYAGCLGLAEPEDVCRPLVSVSHAHQQHDIAREKTPPR